MNNFIALLLLFSIFTYLSQCQDKLFWYIEPCRITTLADGTFDLCQFKSICASENTGTTVQCSQFTYVTISVMEDCIKDCCWDLNPLPTTLVLEDIKKCFDQAKLRQTLYVVKVVFSVCGSIGLVIGLISIYFCAFVTNPYTGKKVYVGCCCCRKPADFQQDRLAQYKSGQTLQKNNVMEMNEKKINKIKI